MDMTVTGIGSVVVAELRAAGHAGTASAHMLDLSAPRPNFVEIASGLGVPAVRAHTAQELVEQLKRAYAEPGPHLIEAIVPAVI